MGGTKIFVLQLKELIKSAIFALAGLALIILLIYLFVPHDKEQPATPSSAALYQPGTYSSEIILHNNPVQVDVTVSDNEIISVSMQNMAENQEVFYPLFEPAMETLSQAILENQSLEITPSADYPVTGGILLKAVNAALEQAKSPDQTY